MSNEKMREEFELAYLEEINDGSILVTINDIRNSRAGNEYQVPIISGAWWAWQASREAMVIELPDGGNSEEYAYGTPVFARGVVMDAMQAAGMKVKS